MRKDLFAIPVFETQIKLNKIKTIGGEFQPTWELSLIHI